MKKNQKRGVDGGRKDVEVTKFSMGDYVLLTHPKQLSRNVSRPNGYHLDLVKVKDLITNRESLVHASRLRPFKHPKDICQLRGSSRW